MQSQRRAFSLIEVMIGVLIIGVLAAIAIPAFSTYIARSKAAEASDSLSAMFIAAATYYDRERNDQGQSGTLLTNCTVPAGGPQPATPSAAKQAIGADASLDAIGFKIADFVYFSYRLNTTLAAGCNQPANQDVYTLAANGDLDGDGILSTFELGTRTDTRNSLYKGGGLYINQEQE